MNIYWEKLFNDEGPLWKFFPSDSAVETLELFRANHVKKVLVPGCGYGRNARIFHEGGMDVSGIEISASAIRIAHEHGLHFKIYHGSVTSMPFNDEVYDGIYCYALLHLLNKHERLKFLKACYKQLKPGGIMVHVIASIKMSLHGSGRYLSWNRYEVPGGLKVFFYDHDSVRKEFSDFGLADFHEISEPVKFMEDHDPVRMIYVICRKQTG